jgi:hypothetical protein
MSSVVPYDVLSLVLDPRLCDVPVRRRAAYRLVARQWNAALRQPTLWPANFSSESLSIQAGKLLCAGKRAASLWLLNGPFGAKIDPYLVRRTARCVPGAAQYGMRIGWAANAPRVYCSSCRSVIVLTRTPSGYYYGACPSDRPPCVACRDRGQGYWLLCLGEADAPQGAHDPTLYAGEHKRCGGVVVPPDTRRARARLGPSAIWLWAGVVHTTQGMQACSYCGRQNSAAGPATP